MSINANIMLSMEILHKLKKHPVFEHSEMINSICQPLVDFGITYFSHGHLNAQGSLSFLSTCPHFIEVYLKKGYHEYDLHKLTTPVDQQYVIWDSVKRKQQSAAMHEDFMSFGRGHTFSIIRNNGNTIDCFHFAGKLGYDSINDHYLNNIEILNTFILYFKDQVAKSKELACAYDMKINLSNTVGGYLIETDEYFSQESRQKFNDMIALDRIYLNGGHDYVTKREYECLHWFSLGKTTEEIAMIMQITARTVSAHIVNIKERLGCSNLFQLGQIYASLKSKGLVKL